LITASAQGYAGARDLADRWIDIAIATAWV
jgi:hypothetical protein